MKEWQHHLHFESFYLDDTLSIQEKGKQVASVLQHFFSKHKKLLHRLNDENLWPDNFEDTTSITHFDSMMSVLYDWADDNSVWIHTREGM